VRIVKELQLAVFVKPLPVVRLRVDTIASGNVESGVASRNNPQPITQKGKSNMNKGELIDKIAKDTRLSKVQAGNALNSTLEGVVSTLKRGGKVTLVGFGTFSVGSRRARTGRNPQTGQPLKISAKRVTKFAAGTDLKKAVNRGR
jgi:DNA-binding protein HU-beta